MKKSFLALSLFILPSTVFATYTVFVPKVQSNYESKEGFTYKDVYTDWLATGVKTCNTLIESDSIYKGFIEQVDYNCSEPQERTKTTYKVYNEKDYFVSSEKETQISETIEQKDLIGTHLENNCNDILTFNNEFSNQDGYYESSIGQINCDMTTQGGGWTQVSNITALSTVVETNSWINNIGTKDASFAVKYFNTYNPEKILLANKSSIADSGSGDLIIITRNNASWGWTPYTFNNDQGQTGSFYDSSSNTWSSLGTLTFASHQGSPWQYAAFGFTMGLSNGYSGNYTGRVLLGGTFKSSLSDAYPYSFYGNIKSMYPDTYGNWRDYGSMEVWMK